MAGAAPVGGDFAITGTLPSIDDVIAFKEGTGSYPFGYYRFVPHPLVATKSEELARLFGARHCRLAESPEVALLELLLCLRPQGKTATVCGLPPLLDSSFLPACEREDFTFCQEPAELTKGDILVLAGNTHGEAARRAAEKGATVIAFLPKPPKAGPEIPAARFWVIGIGNGARGGAVISSSDRVMKRLAEQTRRRGPLLSSRELADCAVPEDGAENRVCEALCAMEGGARAFLYASGMSAITRALDLVRRPGRSRIVAVGHLFSDTVESLRLLPGTVFLGVDELDRLPDLITDRTAAVLTETITNPLNDVPDLEQISEAARRRGIPLIVDNTLATPLLCRPLALGADIVIHSTTKFLNGRNNHGGGALVVGNREHAQGLEEMRSRWNDGMSPREAGELEKNMATLSGRMERFTANAGRVASFLSGHPGVKRLYASGDLSHRCFATAKRILRGPSSVISFTLARDSVEGLRAFYDPPLPGIVKAPSLGSDWTLVCPYVLLSHYHETDGALRSAGLSRWLVRLSVGCEEDIQPVIDSLDAGLARVLA